MAFVDDSNGFIDDDANKQYPFAYNVTMPVDSGQGQFQDVLLVQYFLANIYANPTAFQPPLPPPPPNALVLDGTPGPITGAWIQAFQDYVLALGGAMIVNDGRVDRALPRGGLTPIHQATYTIMWLNSYFAVARPGIDFTNIAGTDPNCPPQLADLLCLQM